MDLTAMLLIYNEKGNIKPQTQDILKVYDDNELDGEVLLIDDGSTDGSAGICDALAKKYKRVRVKHHKPNIGRSYAIRTGFQNAKGKITILMDGDRQYDPTEIPKFAEKMAEGWDVVSGNRTGRADNWIRRFISRTYNRWIIGKSLGLDIVDQNSGFKAFDTKKAVKMGFNPEGFLGLHRFILPLARIKGMSVTEIPIKHFDRPEGKSYIKFYTVPFITYRDFRKFKKKYKKEIKAYKKKKKS